MKIIYLSGPGNALSDLEVWSKGETYASEVATTYTSQFFDFVKNGNHEAIVLSCGEGDFSKTISTITHRMIRRCSQGRRGFSFHFQELLYFFRIARVCSKFKPRVFIASDFTHWWLFSLLSIFGVRVIPDMHCTIWPKGSFPTGLSKKIILLLNSFYFRIFVRSVICVSTECAAQVKYISNGRAISFVYYPSFNRVDYDCFSRRQLGSADTVGFVYVGRIEADKGIWDLLYSFVDAVIKFKISANLVFCGSGSDLKSLQEEVNRIGFTDSITCKGALKRGALLSEYASSHVLIVPTTKDFQEGFNKVVVEGVLTKLPVIASDVCPSVDCFSENQGVVRFRAGDSKQLADMIKHFSSPLYYNDFVSKSLFSVPVDFFYSNKTWHHSLKSALSD